MKEEYSMGKYIIYLEYVERLDKIKWFKLIQRYRLNQWLKTKLGEHDG